MRAIHQTSEAVKTARSDALSARQELAIIHIAQINRRILYIVVLYCLLLALGTGILFLLWETRDTVKINRGTLLECTTLKDK